MILALPRPMLVPTSFTEALEAEHSVAFVLDRGLKVHHVNSAWTRAAAESGYEMTSGLALIGTPYLDCVVGPLRDVLAGRFEQALAKRAGPSGLLIETECNTPDTARRLTTHVIPMTSPKPREPYRGLLLIHTIEPLGPLAERYPFASEPIEEWRNGQGLLLQCSGCRRCRDARNGSWKMNAAVVATRPPRISHSMCPTCIGAYYPELAT